MLNSDFQPANKGLLNQTKINQVIFYKNKNVAMSQKFLLSGIAQDKKGCIFALA
jgi:hypothetical protein